MTLVVSISSTVTSGSPLQACGWPACGSLSVPVRAIRSSAAFACADIWRTARWQGCRSAQLEVRLRVRRENISRPLPLDEQQPWRSAVERPEYGEREPTGPKGRLRGNRPGLWRGRGSRVCAGQRILRTASVGFRAFGRSRVRSVRTYSGQRHRLMNYITVFPQVRGIIVCVSLNTVKPSAQPTLVRTQHLPPPAETAR
jgi:hypothetical protein